MSKQKITFRSRTPVAQEDLEVAFQCSTSIGISYFKGKQESSKDFNPRCKEESKLIIPGLKLIFYADSEILLVIPLKTGNSSQRLHQTLDDCLRLSKFLKKEPIISSINCEISISER